MSEIFLSPVPEDSGKPGDPGFVGCPYCTIQIPVTAAVCPHCHHPNPAARDFREFLVPPERFPEARKFLRRYRKLLAVAAVAAALALLAPFLHHRWTVRPVMVNPNPAFRMEVAQERNGANMLLQGTITNLGEDIPDLSLRSVRVTAVFWFRDGRALRRVAYPVAAYRSEGALLRGETGCFRFDAPAEGLEKTIVGTEVIDLAQAKVPVRNTHPSPVTTVQ